MIICGDGLYDQLRIWLSCHPAGMFADTILAGVGSFALVAGLVTITPGLDTALVLRSALTKGRWPAYATALGVCSGVLVWGMAAAVGISALLTASEVAYTVLRLVGAAYLIWLGLRLLWAAIRRDRVTEATTGDVAPGTSGWAAWRQGFGANILNPKIGAFYVALLPPVHSGRCRSGADGFVAGHGSRCRGHCLVQPDHRWGARYARLAEPPAGPAEPGRQHRRCADRIRSRPCPA